MTKLQILLIGDFARREFAAIRAALSDYGDITDCADVRAAIRATDAAAHPPDVIAVAQQRPGEIAAPAFERLRRAAPLAPILGVQGSWCEGETRTGHPWPGMLRTYWHAWLPRWLGQFDRLAADRLPLWGLPTTCTEDERIMSGLGTRPHTTPKLIAIYSRSNDMADMLCDACAKEGHLPVWADPRRPFHIVAAQAVIWDGTGEAFSELSNVSARLPSVPILALIDFPRLDEVETLMRNGAAAVTSVPFLLGDLFIQLDQLITDMADPSARCVA